MTDENDRDDPGLTPNENRLARLIEQFERRYGPRWTSYLNPAEWRRYDAISDRAYEERDDLMRPNGGGFLPENPKTWDVQGRL